MHLEIKFYCQIPINPDEVVFGANMTTLTFALSRGLARQLQPGDEIILTRLGHDANLASWSALQEVDRFNANLNQIISAALL